MIKIKENIETLQNKISRPVSMYDFEKKRQSWSYLITEIVIETQPHN